jgi:alkanesulfonate monooxygenase SsuD/methylene tetrahydromethanopterin reductase-like flavin-dependent oxidoreductase (luciferase family)
MPNQEKIFTGEIGIHYPLHVLNRYSLPELIGLAERAWQTMEKLGFSQAYAENRGVDYAASLTPDEAVDRLIIAGTPAQCNERIAELFALAARDGFTQVTIGVPLGPDIPEVIDLWGTEILPAMR